jgi:hypothetical protein
VEWLLVSLILSLVLTLVANVALHVFPELGSRLSRWLATITSPDDPDDRASARSSRVRVIFPWKTMIAVSIILTVLLTLLRWMT